MSVFFAYMSLCGQQPAQKALDSDCCGQQPAQWALGEIVQGIQPKLVHSRCYG